MKKTILDIKLCFWILVFVPFMLSAQQGIEFYSTYNLPIYNKYDGYYKNFQDGGGRVDLHHFNSGINAQVYGNHFFSLRLGMGYKFTDLILRDEVDSVDYDFYTLGSHGHTNNHTTTYYFGYDKPDFHNRSHLWSVNMDFRFILKKGKYSNQNIGLIFNYYFYEYYHTFYTSREIDSLRKNKNDKYLVDREYSSLYFRNQQTYLTRNFFTSAIDLQLYYQYNWNISDNFSLGVRASIGTNLYSDWKQFKKYVWAGFGLNVGFLKNEKVRLNKGEL